jgi:hypothetical protein
MRPEMTNYTPDRWTPVLVLFCVIVAVGAREGPKFDRSKCRDEIIALQKQTNFTKNTPEYFFQDPTSRLLKNGSDNMTVALAACYEFCGSWTFYWDAVPRLTTWILPVLLLLSNIELSPIDKKRFMTVIHALGDPIDSFWSLIHKIYIWHRLYEIGLKKSPREDGDKKGYFARIFSALVAALVTGWHRFCEILRLRPPSSDARMTRGDRARIIASVLAGFEEISGAKIESENYYHMITQQLGQLGEPGEDPKKFEEWRRTARILADARTNEFLRTCLAIFVYIFGLIAAFITGVGGGNTTPPGGRIGSAIFLSWLVPLGLLSNTIGTFTSRRTCLTIMRQFVWVTTRPAGDDDPGPQNDAGRVSPTVGDTEPEGGTSNVAVAQPGMQGEATSTLPTRMDRHGITGEAAVPLRNLHGSNITAASTRDEVQDNTTNSNAAIAQPEVRSSTSQPATTHRNNPANQRLNPQDDVEPNLISTGNSNSNVNWQGNFAPATREDDTTSSIDRTGLIDMSSWDDYFESLQWLGAIYTYRPWKVLYLDIDHRTHAHRRSVMMAVGGVFPIAVGAAGAFIIIWYAVPKGFSCRHIWVIGIPVLWIISAICTSMTYIRYKKRFSGHTLWLVVLIKDAIIGLSSISMIILSTGGLFNNCWCWSAHMTRRQGVYVPLSTDEGYAVNARNIYSIVVGTCIGVQFLFYVGLMLWWQQGVELVRWTESRRRKEWRHEMEENVEYTDDNFLLFWYEGIRLERVESERQGRHRNYSVSRGRPIQV